MASAPAARAVWSRARLRLAKERLPVRVLRLGRVRYRCAQAFQHWAQQRLLSGRGEPLIIVQEFAPVLTLGKNANAQAGLLCPPAELTRAGVDLEPSGRGGQLTAHEPGQLVCYLILPLQRLGLGPTSEGVPRMTIRCSIWDTSGVESCKRPRSFGHPGRMPISAKPSAGWAIRGHCSYTGCSTGYTTPRSARGKCDRNVDSRDLGGCSGQDSQAVRIEREGERR